MTLALAALPVEGRSGYAARRMLAASFPEAFTPFEVVEGRDLTPGRPLIARLVGRRFENIIDGVGYTKPFDPGFGKSMVKTLSYLLTALGASFGLAEHTELSLFAIAGGGDARRLLSRIAGESSAKLSLLIGSVCTFETRLYQLPEVGVALDYFRWRQTEAHLRAVDRYCQFVLGQSGAESQAAERVLSGLDPDEKVELLRQNGLDFQGLPSWQRRGAAVALRADANAPAPDGQETRARMVVDLNLPADVDFVEYLKPLLGLPT